METPKLLLSFAESARLAACLGALAIGFLPRLSYRPIRFVAYVLAASIGIDAARERWTLPVLHNPEAFGSGIVRGADGLDVMLLLLGLTLPACAVWLAFGVEPDDERADLHVYAWLVGTLALYGFLIVPAGASWTTGEGYRFALAGIVNVAALPGFYAFARWLQKRRAPRVEHFAGLAFLVAHCGMAIGPYSVIWPDPFGKHTVFAAVLYGLAFVAALYGEARWLYQRTRYSSRS